MRLDGATVPLVLCGQYADSMCALRSGPCTVRVGEEPSYGTITSWRNYDSGVALRSMFLFYSNLAGIAGSILVSVVLSLALLYACSGP